MNFVFLLIIGFVIGMALYMLDRKRGNRWYKSWYDLTHEFPLDALPDHGLVYRRPSKSKLTWAGIIASVIFLVLILLGLDHPVTAVIDAAGALIGSALAFFVAPFIFKIDRSQVEQVLSKFDESKDNSVMEKPKPGPVKVDPPIDEKKEESELKKDDDWRAGIDKFLDKK